MIRRWFLALSALDLFIWYLRVLTRGSRLRSFWWPWFIFQVISGYPPGELRHWDNYPQWFAAIEPEIAFALATKGGDPELKAELREWHGDSYWGRYPDRHWDGDNIGWD